MFGVVVFGNEFTKDVHPKGSSNMNSVTLVDVNDRAIATADVESYVSLLDLPLLGTAELNKVDGITFSTFKGIEHHKVTGYSFTRETATVGDSTVDTRGLAPLCAGVTIEISVAGFQGVVELGGDVLPYLPASDDVVSLLSGYYMADGHRMSVKISKSAYNTNFLLVNGTSGDSKLMSRNGTFEFDKYSNIVGCNIPRKSTDMFLSSMDLKSVADDAEISFVKVNIAYSATEDDFIPHSGLTESTCVDFATRKSNMTSPEYIWGQVDVDGNTRKLIAQQHVSRKARHAQNRREAANLMFGDNEWNRELKRRLTYDSVPDAVSDLFAEPNSGIDFQFVMEMAGSQGISQTFANWAQFFYFGYQDVPLEILNDEPKIYDDDTMMSKGFFHALLGGTCNGGYDNGNWAMDA
ncbi:hypothetical protein JL721_11629 [Aureococcus anophagefferens]|nr:hypothetical protein JL721_11629 [Aureococcus anophagefferens]